MTTLSTSPLNAQNPTYVYVGAFIDELARSGLRHVVICPGSRSTPLAMTFAASPAIRVWMHVDERSAAFFALGMAKRLGQPVALLCTSGTAAANFLPAIVEAHLTHVPLLVLTSDRPHELRDCGAPQAIDQNRLYGTHVKWFVDTALPEATNEALRYIRTIANRALAQTRAIPVGPVHLNMPFREPLVPTALANQSLPPLLGRDPLAWQGRPDNQPYTQVDETVSCSASSATITQLAQQISALPRGLIIVGPQTAAALARPLVHLARLTGYPLLADPLSQLRTGVDRSDPIISSYDAFLRSERLSAQFAPQYILRFGAMPTSKPLLLYLKRYAACKQILIDGQAGWEEPTQLAAQVIHADPVSVCQSLSTTLEQIAEKKSATSQETSWKRDADWIGAWQAADRVTRQALASAIADFREPFEGRIFTEVGNLLPAGALLYVGNSMPVRDMDTFFWNQEKPLLCLGNRGANGIDGVVSSALGASATADLQEKAMLVIGDLSFFHDLNGLLAARLHALNLVILLINNDGGGIFSFLPQAAYPEHFEQLFGTPTGLEFRAVVEMYGGTFQRVRDWESLRRACENGIKKGGLHVLEIPTERESNVSMHRQLWPIVEQALQQANLFREGEE